MKNPVRAAIIAILFLVSGCAVDRSVLDIRVGSLANPSDGQAVQIIRVTDGRIFQSDPSDPSTPSIKDGEIHNISITSRAVARKRGGFGNAWGDVVLPENRLVAQLLESAIARAFQEAGYRVVGKDDPQSSNALPVEADIDRFWSWMTPGFWAIALECKTRIRIKAPVAPFQSGEYVEGYARDTFQAATEENWQEILNKGIDDFIRNLRGRLQSANAK